MKKLFAGILATALLMGAMAGITACGEDDRSKEIRPEPLEVYAPDGAPALALAHAIAQENEGGLFDFDIVDASTIQTYVTGAAPKADLCILPVNIAAKFLGTGTDYQMLGTVTNGNLYFLTTGDNAVLTKENLATLKGKKVGVVQLQNVPGLTLQAILKDNGIDYQAVQSVEDEAIDAQKVNLIPFEPGNVTPAGKCDYYLCPEPAASAKIKGTASAPAPFKDGGDLQAIYGETGGYPQAVAVAKKSVIESRAADVKIFLDYLEGADDYLSAETTTAETVLKLLEDEREDGVAPSFSAANLTKEVIARCSVGFTASKDCKTKVVAFLEKLIAINAGSTAKPTDGFFYMG